MWSLGLVLIDLDIGLLYTDLMFFFVLVAFEFLPYLEIKLTFECTA